MEQHNICQRCQKSEKERTKRDLPENLTPTDESLPPTALQAPSRLKPLPTSPPFTPCTCRPDARLRARQPGCRASHHLSQHTPLPPLFGADLPWALHAPRPMTSQPTRPCRTGVSRLF